MKNLAQLYSLSVCLIATIITLVTSIFLIISIINITLFDIRYKGALNKYNTNESYLDSIYDSRDRDRAYALDPQELTKLRIHKKNDYIYATKAELVNSMVDQIVYFIMSLLFIAIHFKIYRKCLQNDRRTLD